MCYTCILASIGFPDLNLIADDLRGDFLQVCQFCGGDHKVRLLPNQEIRTPEFDTEDPNIATNFDWYKSASTNE